MSFLTPLYLLGALAVGLPVLFHMIRRTPRGRREFSSVMFLEPSPPRITRRSRIEHWLLLILRAVAVCLLALAFARPFLRVTQEQAIATGQTRDYVVLLDTSASMRREGIWREAVARVESLLDDMGPLDRLTLMSFDVRPRVLVDFTQWTALDPAQRVASAQTALRALTPSWAATDLGHALIEAAERLDAEATGDEMPRSRIIVLVSDLQDGSRLDALESYQWPPQVHVRLENLGAGVSPNNAGVQPFASQAAAGADNRLRVRVANAADSRRERFRLRWDDQFDVAAAPSDDGPVNPQSATDSAELTVVVPPGQSRALSAPPIPAGAGTRGLVLEGDDHDFDNRCYVPVPAQRSVTVAVLSEHAADDQRGLWYYVERALPSTSDRAVNVRPLDEIVAAEGGESPPELIIVTAAPSAEQSGDLRIVLEAGGTLLLVPVEAADVSLLYELLEIAPVEAQEADVDTYAMLTDIDFSHPLFAALDHPRYSDFTKVRFWKHRTIDPASFPDVRVLARFDDGDMAIGELPLGEGRVVFFTSGWDPDDSQLALSTKFVPMLNGLLDDAAGIVERRQQFVVADTIDLSPFVPPGDRATSVQTPDGDEIALDAEVEVFTMTDRPGRYRVRFDADADDGSAEFVVNLDPAESQTSPLPPRVLAAADVTFEAPHDEAAAAAEGARQLRGSELENRQKVWRWLIVAAMIVLLTETWLAGRLSREGTVST